MSESKAVDSAVFEGAEASLEASEKKKVKKKKTPKEKKRPTQENHSSARGDRKEFGDGIVDKKGASSSPRRGAGAMKKASEERFSAERFKSPQRYLLVNLNKWCPYFATSKHWFMLETCIAAIPL